MLFHTQIFLDNAINTLWFKNIKDTVTLCIPDSERILAAWTVHDSLGWAFFTTAAVTLRVGGQLTNPSLPVVLLNHDLYTTAT